MKRVQPHFTLDLETDHKNLKTKEKPMQNDLFNIKYI